MASRRFIENSPDLRVVSDELVRPVGPSTSSSARSILVVSYGSHRDPRSLVLPPGAYERGRMGKQAAGLIWPNTEIVTPLHPQGEHDRAILVADLMDTHQGELFRFHHSTQDFASELDKYALWPSIAPCGEGLSPNNQLVLKCRKIQFEDRYLELMLRFFSGCSPVWIVAGKVQREGMHADDAVPIGDGQFLHMYGYIQGPIDLGYLLHPSDAKEIALRLRNGRPYTPVPSLRYIRDDMTEPFLAAFVAAASA